MSDSASAGNLDRFQVPSVPLNWSMYQLLATLMETIDERHCMLGDRNEDGLVTEVCSVCMGLGINLVVGPPPSDVDDGESGDDDGDSDDDDDAPAAGPSGVGAAGATTAPTTTTTTTTTTTAPAPTTTTTTNTNTGAFVNHAPSNVAATTNTAAAGQAGVVNPVPPPTAAGN
ncbi:hypothetical protein EST38_g10595, partial [Candolleomyces aberdarensis]